MASRTPSTRGGRGNDPTRMSGFAFARLMFATVVVAIGYTLFSVGSIGKCFGSAGADGCVTVELKPEQYVYFVIVVLAIGTMVLVRRQLFDAAAERRATTIGILVIVLVGVIFSALHSLAFFRWSVGEIFAGMDIVLPFLSNATVTWS
ncbi:MAG: hypothetical protein JWQ43_865 [Glaciihabitans sp.]|nr:hypothetical protein [Glaciihabitans sp.]